MYCVINGCTDLIRHVYENWFECLGHMLAVSARLLQRGHECLDCYGVVMATPSPLL